MLGLRYRSFRERSRGDLYGSRRPAGAQDRELHVGEAQATGARRKTVRVGATCAVAVVGALAAGVQLERRARVDQGTEVRAGRQKRKGVKRLDVDVLHGNADLHLKQVLVLKARVHPDAAHLHFVHGDALFEHSRVDDAACEVRAAHVHAVENLPAQRLHICKLLRDVRSVRGNPRNDGDNLHPVLGTPLPAHSRREVHGVARAVVLEPLGALGRSRVDAVRVEVTRRGAALALVNVCELAVVVDLVPRHHSEAHTRVAAVVPAGLILLRWSPRIQLRGPLVGGNAADLGAHARLLDVRHRKVLQHVPLARTRSTVRAVAHEPRLEHTRAAAPVAVDLVAVVALLTDIELKISALGRALRLGTDTQRHKKQKNTRAYSHATGRVLDTHCPDLYI